MGAGGNAETDALPRFPREKMAATVNSECSEPFPQKIVSWQKIPFTVDTRHGSRGKLRHRCSSAISARKNGRDRKQRVLRALSGKIIQLHQYMVYVQCIKYVKLNPLGGKATSKAESNPGVPSHTHTSPITHHPSPGSCALLHRLFHSARRPCLYNVLHRS